LKLERAQTGLLAGLAATASISIFASETLLALSLLLLAVRLVRERVRLGATSSDTPLAAFAVWTLLSASFASDPARSHEDAKKLVLFALFYVALEVMARDAGHERALSALLLGGLALATLVVLQHHFLGYDRVNHRPPGFLGHYMTAAGAIMVSLLVAASRLAFGRRPRLVPSDGWLAALVVLGVAGVAAFDAAGHPIAGTRLFVAALAVLAAALALSRSQRVRAAEAMLPLVVVPLAAWALVVSQTRGVWIGAVVGLALTAFLRAPRLLALGAVLLLALVVWRPAPLVGRLTMSDASSVDRYYMWQAGIDMIVDRPVFGMGPGMILRSYPSYRWPEAPNPNAPHLHNNLLQLAAERGLPGLAFFLWWALAAVLTALGELRGRNDPATGPAAVAACAGLAAIFAAGLFEYNLGDSEVLMLVLLLMAVPYALARARALSA
jgi:O-antigen ligase